MNDWSSRRAAAPNFTLTQHCPRCERMQRENQIHRVGSKPPCGGAEQNPVCTSSECRLSPFTQSYCAPAANAHFPALNVMPIQIVSASPLQDRTTCELGATTPSELR